MFLYTLYGSPQCPSPTALITFSYTLHTYGEYYITIETFTRPSTKPTSAVLSVATTRLKAGLEIRVGCASRLGWLSQSWQWAGSCGRDLIPVTTSGSVLQPFALQRVQKTLSCAIFLKKKPLISGKLHAVRG